MEALAQLRGSAGQSAVSLAAIIVSFSLMVAMAIMVYSFRESFDRWLGQVLPADLHMRIAQSGDTAFWSPAEQAAIFDAGVAWLLGATYDGVVDARDLLIAARILEQSIVVDPADEVVFLRRADVAPLVNGQPSPNDVFDIADLLERVRITRGDVGW